MKRRSLLFLCGIVFLLLLIPRLFGLFEEADSSISYLFTLVLIPVSCAILGGFAGLHFKKRWFLSFVPSLLNLILALAFFEIKDSQSVIYSVLLLLISIVTMFLMAMVRSFLPKNTG